MLLPVAIGDYTDFYASIFHATNVGRLFRPDNPLLPNYKYVPIGYHGRASSIVVSGTPIRRRGAGAGPGRLPAFGPTRALDYELEVGFFIGGGQRAGRADPDRVRRGSRLRHLPGQRLVGARYTGLGIPAARPVSRQELRDHASRRGWYQWKRWLRIARRSTRVRRATPRRCRISIRRRIGRAARSISRSKWRSPARRCARAASRRSA